uniref:Putative secreted protein n=1 Tax=Anopheles triannulatus TaxID=58253 RepID=A0A2M4B4K9_9DIPT
MCTLTIAIVMLSTQGTLARPHQHSPSIPAFLLPASCLHTTPTQRPTTASLLLIICHSIFGLNAAQLASGACWPFRCTC